MDPRATTLFRKGSEQGVRRHPGGGLSPPVWAASVVAVCPTRRLTMSRPTLTPSSNNLVRHPLTGARASAGARAAMTGRVRVLFASILALLGVAVVLAVAGVVGTGPRTALLIAAGVAVVAAGSVAAAMLLRRDRQWRATSRDLRSAEAHVNELIEAAMDPIISVDANQRVVTFNAAAEAVFQRSRLAVIGQPLDMLIPARLREAHRAHIDRFAATGVTSRRMGAQAVLTALRADGAEFPIEASISQHEQDGQKRFTGILRDVSERVRGQTMLARSEARLRGILDSAMDAIVTVDDDQRIVLFNAAAESMFVCSQREAVGLPLDTFIPARLRGVHGNHVRQFGSTGSAARRMGATRIVTGLRRNGEEFPIDASISQLGDGDTRFYTVILRDVSERLKALEALRRSKEELQELSSTSHIAREQEKNRIARELHDELGQALTMLQMDVAWCRAKAPSAEPEFAVRLDRMQALLKSTVAATRRIAADLRPLLLDDLGIVPAVEWLAENFTQRTGVPCRLTIEDPDLELDGVQATAVFRIVQESLTNIAKHAGAADAEVSIAQEDDWLVVRVSDDGKGFIPQDPRKPGSFGLVGLRERAALLRGEAKITSGIGEGTTIEVRLPFGATGAAT